jgi:hypothetical protein
MPTTDAMMSPINPMKKNCPTPARLLRVTVPKNAVAPNMPAVMIKVEVMDEPV